MPAKQLTFDIFGRDVTASKTIAGVGNAATRVQAPFLKLGGVIAGAFAVDKILDFAKTSVSAYAEAQAQETKLSDAVERYPALKGASLKALHAFNTELEHSTRFDDDALAVAEAQLAQYGLNAAQLKKLIPLVADYAAKTGTDVSDASETLGKALLGQGRALKGVGINFKDTGSVAGNFGEIVDGLSDKVGGFANKDVQNADGKLANLKNRVGDVEENIGQALIPTLGKLADLAEKDVLPKVTKFSNWFSKEGGPALERYAPKIEHFLVETGQDVAALVKSFAPLGGVALGGLGVVIHLVEQIDPNDLVTLVTAATGAYTAFRLWGGLQPIISGVATSLGAVAVAEDAASGWIGILAGGIGLIAGAFLGAQQPSQDAVQVQQDFAGALEQSNDAIDKNVRLLAAKKLQEDGAFKAANALGISNGLLVKAVIGNAGAQDELNKKLDAQKDKYTQLQIDEAHIAAGRSGHTNAVIVETDALKTLTSVYGTVSGAIDTQLTKNQVLKQAVADSTDTAAEAKTVFDGLGRSIKNIPSIVASTITIHMTTGGNGAVFSDARNTVLSSLQKHAAGGSIFGPGTWTSDSVPILGSTGEEVIRAASASKPGARAFLKAFNDDPSTALAGISGAGGGDIHVHVHVASGFIGSSSELAKAVRSVLVTGERIGAIPKTVN